MSWEIEYSRKLKTAAEALRVVESGMRVWAHANSGCPAALMSALTDRAPDVRNVEICHLLSFTDLPTAGPQYAASFRHKSFFLGSNVRTAVAEGRADYVPIHLHEVERLMESGKFPIDVALIQITPPDRHGFVSLGPCVEATLTAARCAKYVIAQVNSHVPRTCGNTHLHVRADFDSGRIHRRAGQALCGKDGWMPRPPEYDSEFSDLCPRCVEIANR